MVFTSQSKKRKETTLRNWFFCGFLFVLICVWRSVCVCVCVCVKLEQKQAVWCLFCVCVFVCFWVFFLFFFFWVRNCGVCVCVFLVVYVWCVFVWVIWHCFLFSNASDMIAEIVIKKINCSLLFKVWRKPKPWSCNQTWEEAAWPGYGILTTKLIF